MGSACSSEAEISSAPRATHNAAPNQQHKEGGKYATASPHQRDSSLETLTGDIGAKRAGPISHGGPTTATRTTTTLVEADDEGEEAEMPGRGGPDSGPQGLKVGPRKLEPAQLQRIKVASLRTTVLGECLNADQLALIATMSELKKYSRVGEQICQQGSRAACVYFVHKGEVILEVQDAELDNTPNQAQVARVMAQQLLAPIAAPDQMSGPLPEVQQRARMMAQAARAQGGAGAAAGHPDSLPLHPAAMHVQRESVAPRGGHTAQKKSSTQAGRERHQSMGLCLTRAEVIASEAAARIEREALADDADAAAAAAAASGGAPSPTHAHNGSLLEEPVIPAHASSRRPSADAAATGDVLFPGNGGSHSPAASLSSISDTMYMCAKGANQCFGAELILTDDDAAPVSYAYSGINNSLSTHLICVPVKAFEALWMTYPTIKPLALERLGESLHACLSSTPWIGGVLPPPKVSLLASLFTQARVEGGTVLFQEGDMCSDDSPLYYIVSGEVELTLTNERGFSSTKLLGPKTLFGSLGAALGFTVTASAVCLGPCTLRLCKRRWLGLFFMSAPAALQALRSSFSEWYHVRDEQLLEHPRVQRGFTEFCLKEFCGENVEFYNAALRFRKVLFPLLGAGGPEEDVPALLAEAAAIYNRFISATSILQINIKQGVRTGIKESLQSGEISRDLFYAAEREICNLMLLDTFGRFKSSPLYAQAVGELAPPLPLPVLLNHVNLSGVSGIHGFRNKEYSRTEEGPAANGANAQANGATPAKAQGRSGVGAAASSKAGKSQFARHIELIDDDGEEMCAIRPLMFGGGTRAAPTPSASTTTHQLHVKVSSAPAGQGQSHGPRMDSLNEASMLTPSQGPMATPHHLATPNPDASVLTLSPSKDVFRVRPTALNAAAANAASGATGEPMSASSGRDLASPKSAVDSDAGGRVAFATAPGSNSRDLDAETAAPLEGARSALVSAATSGISSAPVASASSSPNPSRPTSGRRVAQKSAKNVHRPSVIQPPVLKDSPPVSVA
jgi:CRP-like cAMP-binding protein